MRAFSKAGAPCTYSYNGAMYAARLTGNAHIKGEFIEIEICITDCRKVDCGPLRYVGARLWVLPSDLDHPMFLKRVRGGGLIKSGKISIVENSIWKGAHFGVKK